MHSTTATLTLLLSTALAATTATTKPSSTANPATRTPYLTTFPPIPTANDAYAAMTASQHNAYCKTADKKSAWYTRACLDGIWEGLYGRSAPTTMVKVWDVYDGKVGEEVEVVERDVSEEVAEEPEYEFMVEDEEDIEEVSVEGGEVEKRNLANFFTKIADLFKGKKKN